MPRLLARVFRLAAALAVPIVGGCASTRNATQSAAPLPEAPRQAVAIYDHDGARTDWGAMLEAVSGADVIVIGETHGHPLGLEAAACLWDDLLARKPDAALLLEFFERDQQVALDDYLTGVTDEAAFKAAADRSEGNYPAGHRRMIEAAKAAGRPVIAANAPRRYVRKTAPDGYGELVRLREEQRRLYALPDALPQGRYREEFFELMGGGGHGTAGEGGAMPAEMVEKMYRSQSMWDATMADSVARSALRGHRPVVLVVGRFHADFTGGAVQLIERARPDLDVRTLSMVAAPGDSLREEDRARADFVVYVGPGPDEGS